MIYTVTANPSIDYFVKDDNFALGQINEVQDAVMKPGGKGINVALVLHNLGLSSTCWGFLGGFIGQKIEHDLHQAHLITDFVHVKKEARVNLKIMGQGETALNVAGPDVSLSEKNALLARFDDLAAGDLVVLSGGVPTNLGTSFYYELGRLAQGHGAAFVLDATGRSFRQALAASPWLVKPNEAELDAIAGRKLANDQERIAFGQQLVEQGAKNVLLSLGERGAFLINQKTVLYANAPVGNAVNTVGAGDSMVAGFIFAKSKNKDLADCLRFAVACGTATALSSDLAVASQVATLLAQIKIEQA
ncbi:MAG: 1-phosphofructokinase [Lactobacillus sp.]